jgi:hypothetical protein
MNNYVGQVNQKATSEVVEDSDFVARIAERFDLEGARRRRRSRRLMPMAKGCDGCGESFEGHEFAIDAPFRFSGYEEPRGANLCLECFFKSGGFQRSWFTIFLIRGVDWWTKVHAKPGIFPRAKRLGTVNLAEAMRQRIAKREAARIGIGIAPPCDADS